MSLDVKMTDGESGRLLVSQTGTLGCWSSTGVIDGSQPLLSSFNKMHRRKPSPFILQTKHALFIDRGGCEMLEGERCNSTRNMHVILPVATW